MKQAVFKCKDYCIYKVDKTYIRAISDFVVNANYMHHFNSSQSVPVEEIETICQEELSYAGSSFLYIAENNDNEMIGCIRLLKWDKKKRLPMEKLFDIQPSLLLADPCNSSIWHVGRFAVHYCKGFSHISLFKQLMVLAIAPICKEDTGYMLAECDSKLLRVMNILGIETEKLKEGINYLGSETIPVVANRSGLISFYNRHKYLCREEIYFDNKSEVA